MNLKVNELSDTYHVRKLGAEDIEQIYELSCKNDIFYKYHPPFVTRESIWDDMNALPLGSTEEDKFYLGFFEKDTLVAIMDLILGYPSEEVAYIGLFMMNVEYQNKGVGSSIISESLTFLKNVGYQKVRLGVDKGNPQSKAFWQKNGFVVVSENEYICMEQAL